MTLEKALIKTGHRDEFVARANAGAKNHELMAWMLSIPELVACCNFPLGLKSTRRKMDCSAPPGGKRGGRSCSPLTVRNGRSYS